jgi:hypothetical protein
MLTGLVPSTFREMAVGQLLDNSSDLGIIGHKPIGKGWDGEE